MTHSCLSTFLWDRLATCGRVALGLGGPAPMPTRQVDNLPHKTESALRESR
jgi:hypothetical protein